MTSRVQKRIGSTGVVGMILSLILFGSHTLYAESRVEAELDKAVGSIEEGFELTITAFGNVDDEPTLPPIDGVDIQSAGSSSNMSWILVS